MKVNRINVELVALLAQMKKLAFFTKEELRYLSRLTAAIDMKQVEDLHLHTVESRDVPVTTHKVLYVTTTSGLVFSIMWSEKSVYERFGKKRMIRQPLKLSVKIDSFVKQQLQRLFSQIEDIELQALLRLLEGKTKVSYTNAYDMCGEIAYIMEKVKHYLMTASSTNRYFNKRHDTVAITV